MKQWMSAKREEYRRLGGLDRPLPTIKETFSGESVLITGATGVLGKASSS